jgi:hypothetical protein
MTGSGVNQEIVVELAIGIVAPYSLIVMMVVVAGELIVMEMGEKKRY